MANNRKLFLDICDYKHNVLYPLYDNNAKIPGQAHDVVVSTERNGWRELSFALPTVCFNENGESVDNEAIKYLKSEYLIRLIDDYETDWFVISEPKITHSGFSKTINVNAGHISQLLKVKNLGLEFSDTEGNNVGTVEELLTTILDGTGWTIGYIHPSLLVEKKDPEKVRRRSLIASSKTGAFKLISLMCDLFEAKPVYHGDSKTVDILPINPFSAYEPGTIPDLSLADGVIELHYGTNIKNVTRVMNSENIVTKLYAYGAFGNKTDGYCGIDECTHIEYRFTTTSALTNGRWYFFTVKDAANVDITFRFKAANSIPSGDTLIFSLLDPASMMYIWSTSKKKALPTEKTRDSSDLKLYVEGTSGNRASVEKVETKNWFQFLMNFDYYRSNGMMTDEDVQLIAQYQRTAPENFELINQAASDFTEKESQLAEVIGYCNLCKLDVLNTSADESQNYLTLTLDKSTYEDGVIYRSDYDAKQPFKWIACDTLDKYGDPTIRATSVVYIIHDKDGVNGQTLEVPKWTKAYLKEIDDKDNPSVLTLWLPADTVVYPDTDTFFLIQANTINGYLGSLEAADEAALITSTASDKAPTEQRTIIFTELDPLQISTDDIADDAWLWQYDSTGENKSKLYFCNKNKNANDSWHIVYTTNDESTITSPIVGDYFYNWATSVLYQFSSDGWVALSYNPSNEEVSRLTLGADIANRIADKSTATSFGIVYMYGLKRDKYYQGFPKQLTYTVPENSVLPADYYYFTDQYGSFYTFKTPKNLIAGDYLKYDYVNENSNSSNGRFVYSTNNVEDVLLMTESRYDAVNYHPANILSGLIMESGGISTEYGDMYDATDYCRLQGYAPIVPSTSYHIDNLGDLTLHFYTSEHTWITSIPITNSNSFVAPTNARYLKFVVNYPLEYFNSHYQDYLIAADDRTNSIIISNTTFHKLEAVPSGNIGLISLIKQFAELANETYGTAYGKIGEEREALERIEKRMTSALGDMYREGYWQDANYIEGDEDKLYDDAFDNLEKIAYPETTYNIDFLDLYDSNVSDEDFGASSETINVKWSDISISSAAHLVDDEIGINVWAFIDKIQKCYDKPWNTKIVINTNLTTIGQHSFSDVMTNIADVASTVKGKITKYDTTSNTYVAYNDYSNLLADLVTLTKITEKNGGRINEMQNDITGHSSRFIQTANMIATEVERAQSEEQKLSSRIQQTAESITLEVTERLDNMQGAIDELDGSIQQTINETLGYSVSVTSDKGSFITPTTSTLTLSPVVTYAFEDITNTIPASSVTWTRESANTDDDQTWNALASSKVSNKSLVINSTDLDDQAYFVATVNIDGTNYSYKYSVANISKIDQIEVYLVSNSSMVQTEYMSSPPSYSPDWAQSNVTIVPSVYVNGAEIPLLDSNLSVTWKKRIAGGNITDLDPDTLQETVDGKVLTIAANVLPALGVNSVSYICTVSYGDISAMEEKTFTLIRSSVVTESCQITGTQVFRYNADGDPEYDEIKVLAIVNGCYVQQWQYLDANNQWQKYPGSGTSTTLSVHDSDDVFIDDHATIQVLTRKTDNTNGPSDTFSIYKVYAGSQTGTVFFSDDIINFYCDENGVVAPTTKAVNIVAYTENVKDVPQVPSSNWLIGAIPDGMEVTLRSVSNKEIPIVITIPDDGNDYNLGSPEDTSGYIGIRVEYPVNTILRLKWTKTRIPDTANGIASLTTYYAKSPNANVPPERYNLATFDEENGVPVTPIFGKSFLGAKTLWSTTAPVIDRIERYLWAYDVIVYMDGNVEETEPRIIGAYGDEGRSGDASFTFGINTPLGMVFDQNTFELIYEAYVFLGVADITAACNFEWQYYYNSEWSNINIGDDSFSVDLTKNWLQNNCSGGATIRCIATYEDKTFNMFSNIIDKTDNLQAIISSSGGNKFSNGNGTTTLLCRLYQSGKEIDAGGTDYNYTWTRLDANGNEMDATYFRKGKTLNDIVPEDTLQSIMQPNGTVIRTYGDTTFICYVEDPSGQYSTQVQFTINSDISIVYSDVEPQNPLPNMLWVDTSDGVGSNVMYRYDMNTGMFVLVGADPIAVEEAKILLDEHSSRIEELSDQIQLQVNSLKVLEDKYGIITTEQQSSYQSLYDNAINFGVTRVQSIDDGLQNFMTEIHRWMTFDIDKGLTLGKNNETDSDSDNFHKSKFEANLNEERLAFLEDGDVVSYFGNKSMYITEARITQSLNIGTTKQTIEGGWFSYQMEENGLSMTWKADEYVNYRFKAQVNYYNQGTTENAYHDYANSFMLKLQACNEDRTPKTSTNTYYVDMQTNNATGAVYFKTFTFDAADNYYFTIKQVGNIYGDEYDPQGRSENSTPKTIEIDGTEYRVEIVIIKEGSHYEIADGYPKVTRLINGQETEIYEDIQFVNYLNSN